VSSDSENAQIIDLPAVFNHAVVGSVMLQVSAVIDAGKAVRFNASGVERTDGSAVQLLIAVQRLGETSSSGTDETPLLIGCSDILMNAITDFGAESLIEIQAT
jgi:ABC-type transporter Mla MlaB component